MGHLVGDVSSSARGFPTDAGRPLGIVRSQGAHMWDGDGRRFIDTVLGFGATMLGHAPSAVIAPVSTALATNPMPSVNHPGEAAAATALARYTGPLEKIVFTNSGSEAVHLAVRIARAATGRRRIVKMAAGFDGWLDGVVFGNVGSPEAHFAQERRPATEHVVLTRFNDARDIDTVFAEYDDIAAVLVEPMLANAGCLVPRDGYLAHLQAVARRHGALLICDEVLMGFRLHAGLSAHWYGLDPDLASLGKAIGSGIAVAAVAGKAEVMRVLEQGGALRGGTYSGNPVACAAVQATLPLLAQGDYAALRARGDRLRAAIVGCFARHGIAVATSGYGNVFGIWFGAQAPSTYDEACLIADPAMSLALHWQLRQAGVLLMPSPHGRLYLSFAHDDAVVDQLVSAFEKAIPRMPGVRG
ncbi:aminotransferase class III-fold pyridoxal phosphate-dependent enzyme [Robbsia sp. Bb-Pol-6]|uniref:Aminotransferase class III-fold pyridoxal phosphate-dependent enzyme n=1 Tax=Robbsia betulipollinis TaxID=2981849 RepID=A0ABT3ZSW0_9BURK|nr:aminotransferase class III-fold pyridoxal phosphate-dependent enzyme [Robbsia betulipollinis]